MNKLHNAITVSKVTLNVGAGRNERKLEKGMQLIKQLTGVDALKTLTQKRIPTWGLRPGLPVGCKLTLRKKAAHEMLARLIYARDNKLPESCFDAKGNFAFGVKEYIDIKDATYNPDIGMMGLEVAVTLEKPGYRVKKRKIKPGAIGKKHALTKEQAMAYIAETYKVEFE